MYGAVPIGGLNRDHVTGFVVGLGVAATGYYVYMKNKARVDELLASYGIHIPTVASEDLRELTLEDLVLRKENIEDLIAEKELGTVVAVEE